MKYTEHLVNSFFSSNHTGTISGADVVARVVDKSTGDAVKLFLVIEDGVIKNAKFQACGSVVLFASVSAVIDLIINKTVDEAAAITEKQIIKEIKQVNKCDYPMVTFSVKALNTAINSYYKKIKKINIDESRPIRSVRVRSMAPATAISVYEKQESQSEIESIFDNTQVLEEPSTKTEVLEIVEIQQQEPEIVEDVEVPVTPELLESVPTKIEVRIMEEEQVVEIEETSEKEESKKSEDVIDEIDSITAKLTDAITKLNFKFDVDGETDE